jgi:hypothetical protein
MDKLYYIIHILYKHLLYLKYIVEQVYQNNNLNKVFLDVSFLDKYYDIAHNEYKQFVFGLENFLKK